MDPTYHAAVTRLALAAVANLALAPTAPGSAPSLETEPSRGDALRVTWAPEAGATGGYFVAVRVAGGAPYRTLTWSGATELELTGLTPGEPIAVSVAAADDIGHLGPFGPEAARQ